MSFGGSLKCSTFDQIILLLKSSDMCAEAVHLVKQINRSRPNSPTHNVCLVLRKWFSVNKSMEFRCFVKQGGLIGVLGIDFPFGLF